MPLAIDLTGKRALVTGASDGIGMGVARMLAKAGCDVAGTGTVPEDHPRAMEFLSCVTRENRRAVYLQGDLSDPGIPTGLIDRAVTGLGGLDIVISNAGRNAFKKVEETTETDWENCMNLNLAAHWRVAKAAAPALREAKPGVVIIMTSNHAYSTIPGCFPYNIAKAGLLGMVQALAIEWGPAIRVVGLAPGFIDTGGNQHWFDSFPDPTAERARTEAMHPAGRIGTVDEVGTFCAYLCSPAAGFITGNTLLMDGGRSALMQD